jgi:hypothetical protein
MEQPDTSKAEAAKRAKASRGRRRKAQRWNRVVRADFNIAKFRLDNFRLATVSWLSSLGVPARFRFDEKFTG